MRRRKLCITIIVQMKYDGIQPHGFSYAISLSPGNNGRSNTLDKKIKSV